jgi:hypothetical protein
MRGRCGVCTRFIWSGMGPEALRLEGLIVEPPHFKRNFVGIHGVVLVMTYLHRWAWPQIIHHYRHEGGGGGDSCANRQRKRAPSHCQHKQMKSPTRTSTQSESESHCNWRSVSLSVLVSSPGFILPWKLLSCPYGAPSLTWGRVCHLSVIVTCFSQLSVVKIFTILQILTNCMYNIYKASVSPGSVQQTMPYF